jgi:hypothetical protein
MGWPREAREAVARGVNRSVVRGVVGFVDIHEHEGLVHDAHVLVRDPFKSSYVKSS